MCVCVCVCVCVLQALQEKDLADSEKCAGSLISTPLNPTAQGAKSTACVKMVYHAVLSQTKNPSEVSNLLEFAGSSCCHYNMHTLGH